jgi:polar amino acid transport system permease protein
MMMKSKTFGFIAALAFYGLLIFVIIYNYDGKNNFDLSIISRYNKLIIEGFLNTVLISVIVLFLSIIFGFFLYLAVNSKIYFFKYVGSIFSDIVFGSPLVVFIIVLYYFIAAPFDLTYPFIVGTFALSLYMTPYMKNLFEGAMNSIDEMQYQAMTVLGFTTYQKYRYIIIPQLLKVIIPPLIGNLTFVIKGSTLLQFISVPELFYQIETVKSRTFGSVEGYALMFMLYLLITVPLIRLTKYFEKRVS